MHRMHPRSPAPGPRLVPRTVRGRITLSSRRVTGAIAANIDDYGRRKNAMIQQILSAAGLSDAERAAIDSNQVPSHDELPR